MGLLHSGLWLDAGRRGLADFCREAIPHSFRGLGLAPLPWPLGAYAEGSKELTDYGEDLVKQWILAELVACGEVEKEGGKHIFRGHRVDYEIHLEVTPVNKTVRLSEN